MDANATNVRTLVIGAAVAILVTLGVGAGGIAYANGGAFGEQQATGPGIEKAKSVALDHTNGGRVTGTEVGDEEGYYEVEVTRDDGSQLDVHLDRDFDVLSAPADHESSNDQDGASDGGG